MKKIIYFVSTLIILSLYTSCNNDVDIDHSIDFKYPAVSENVVLKDHADFPIGIGVDYARYINDEKYRAIVNKEADVVTYGYHMKHGALVKADGTIDFSKPDQLYNDLAGNNVEVFGHTLIWHQNNNRDYLSTLITLPLVDGGENMIVNGTFEEGINGWNKWNGSSDALSHATGGNDVHSGNGGMKIINAADNPGNQWKTQIQSNFKSALEAGKIYILKFWIRSQSPGSGRCSTSGTGAQYQGDFATSSSWAQVSWTITSNGGEAGLCFDMGAAAGTYFVDDIELKEQAQTDLPAEVVAANKVAVDNYMKSWITNMMAHYKGKVKAWDVVNEPMADGDGGVRKGELPTTGNVDTDVFYWQYFLGKDYAVKAFKYAKAADPDAVLFINDYNLESNTAKLDSFLEYIKEIEAGGAKIDGIGTQMHITYKQYNFDDMFKKLAATGKLIKISELDIKLNPDKIPDYIASEQMRNFQAVTYEQVIKSYLKNVPPAQRYGITFWGVTDADSWIGNDAPCLWDAEYAKKEAYAGVLKGLQAKE